MLRARCRAVPHLRRPFSGRIPEMSFQPSLFPRLLWVCSPHGVKGLSPTSPARAWVSPGVSAVLSYLASHIQPVTKSKGLCLQNQPDSACLSQPLLLRCPHLPGFPGPASSGAGRCVFGQFQADQTMSHSQTPSRLPVTLGVNPSISVACGPRC